MVGVTSFEAYIPPYRLSRAEISRAWGTRTGGGEKAVAKYDEDSLTMGLAATLGCLKGSRRQADGLFFATTTSPYKEKLSATLMAAAADLPEGARTADFTDSLRASTIAIHSAADAVKSRTAENIIVAASDFRMGAGKSPAEQVFGEGAAAIGIGRENVLASIEEQYSLYSEMLDVWRLEGESFSHSWEERFIITEGYLKIMHQVMAGIMDKAGLTPGDFSRIVYYGPDQKSHGALARDLGFDLRAQVQPPLYDTIGNLGTAALPVMLVAALNDASPGDLILAANYGDGGDAFILRVQEEMKGFQPSRSLKTLLEKKGFIPYERYLNWRDMVPRHELFRPESPPPSVTCLWRESKAVLPFYGNKCRHCGVPQYPPQRVCAGCRTMDDFEDYKFSDKTGHIFAFTVDHLTTNREAPAIIGVVDFEGGGRVMVEVTECEPSEIKVGMPVEMCFRKIGLRGGFYNYFWKARPINEHG